jgi:hypothetical protein
MAFNLLSYLGARRSWGCDTCMQALSDSHYQLPFLNSLRGLYGRGVERGISRLYLHILCSFFFCFFC